MEATTSSVAQAVKSDELAAETLRGDIRDVLLMHVRSMETPWSKLTEAQQYERIEAISRTAEKVVRDSVRIVANRGFPNLAMRTGKWNVSDGLKLEVTGAASVDNITRLAEHGQGECILVLSEDGEYFGERRAAKAQPDQPSLAIDDSEAAEGEALGENERQFSTDEETAAAPARGRRRAARDSVAA